MNNCQYLKLFRLKSDIFGFPSIFNFNRVVSVEYFSYLEFLSNTGQNTPKKLSLELVLTPGTSLSNNGSTLSYERLFNLLPNMSYAEKQTTQNNYLQNMFYFLISKFFKS